MRDARVEDVDHISDSDNEDKDDENQLGLGSADALTIGIFPSHQSPVYLHMPTKQDKVKSILLYYYLYTFTLALLLDYSSFHCLFTL